MYTTTDVAAKTTLLKELQTIFATFDPEMREHLAEEEDTVSRYHFAVLLELSLL
jgi:phosphate uptake regulator